jgi:BCD family chlorophyll transporter-like MFS transporter
LWSESQTRHYALFLAVSALFAFMQDSVLEPFGGDVFGLSVGETTRFNAYWGAGVLVGMVGSVLVTRQLRPDQQVKTTALGLTLMAVPMLALGASSLFETLGTVMPGLIAFGFGFGIFTVGGVSLLMAMSAEDRAGSYLALWSVVQLAARGAGIAAGGLVRDVAFRLFGELSTAYAVVFVLEALGLFLSVSFLRRVDVRGFAERRSRIPRDSPSLKASRSAD